jgi:hypothetical protein
MIIALISRPGQTDSGVGRYTYALAQALEKQGHDVVLVPPTVPLPGWLVQAAQRWPGWDLKVFFEIFPIWATYPRADIYHIVSQNLATLMLFRRPPGRTVITVHDILPYMLRDDRSVSNFNHAVDRIFNQLAMWGLRRVHTLLAVSTYTAQTLTEQFGIASDRIVVTWEGVTSAIPAAHVLRQEAA